MRLLNVSALWTAFKGTNPATAVESLAPALQPHRSLSSKFCQGSSYRFKLHGKRTKCRHTATCQLQAGDVLQLDCIRLALGGKGICKHESGLTIFANALPGEKLTARVDKVRKGYAEASKLTTLKQHANPTEAPCPHFGTCGGCDLQNLEYTAQLHAKQVQVAETFQRIGGISNCNDILLPIVACQQAYHYRNNVQFTFSTSQAASHTGKPAQVVLGLHKARQPSQITPVQTCFLQQDSANSLLQAASLAVAQASAQAAGVPLTAFNPATQHGFLRQLILRKNSREEYMVILSTSYSQPALLQPVARALLSCNVPVLSIINTVVPCKSTTKPKRGRSDSRSTSAGQQSHHVIHGAATITEQLCGLHFEISPNSFFQVNSSQAAVLYKLVLQFADLRPTDIVMDLFCGTGSIGLTLAKHCRHVYGFEVAASSIADARRNADLNHISNATFVKWDLTKVSASMVVQHPRPDIIVTDPARSGMSSELNSFLQQSGARKIIYVSCNPATQARDVAQLCVRDGAQYRLTSVQPCDMFPNTAHIECIAVLEHT